MQLSVTLSPGLVWMSGESNECTAALLWYILMGLGMGFYVLWSTVVFNLVWLIVVFIIIGYATVILRGNVYVCVIV